MNFDKESKSEDFFQGGGGGGVWGEREGGVSNRRKENTKKNRYSLIFVFMLYIKFQAPGSSGSLVLTQTKEVTDRLGA